MEASKANCINRSYGAGDGNRTHVRSLGSFYTAIVRRPLSHASIVLASGTLAQRLAASNEHRPETVWMRFLYGERVSPLMMLDRGGRLPLRGARRFGNHKASIDKN